MVACRDRRSSAQDSIEIGGTAELLHLAEDPLAPAQQVVIRCVYPQPSRVRQRRGNSGCLHGSQPVGRTAEKTLTRNLDAKGPFAHFVDIEIDL